MKPLVPSLILAAVVALPMSAVANHEPGHKPVAGTRSGGEGPTSSPGRRDVQREEPTAQKFKGTAGTRSGGEGPATKGGGGTSAAPSFGSFDKNSDGSITSEEAKSDAELTRRFKGLDKDGDGKLSAQEFSVWGGRIRGTAGSISGGEGPSPAPGRK